MFPGLGPCKGWTINDDDDDDNNNKYKHICHKNMSSRTFQWLSQQHLYQKYSDILRLHIPTIS